MIDPMAHAHMNLVGGVSVSVMGLLYFFLPQMLGRPIFSERLAKISFLTIVIGIFGFYLSAITLGAIEGNMMLEKRMTDVEAKEAMGFVHPLLLASSASIMGIGFWTLHHQHTPDDQAQARQRRPARPQLRVFIGFSVIAILIAPYRALSRY
jgi:heme/copper-type cytochrome/quinol oxidase subunit 1